MKISRSLNFINQFTSGHQLARQTQQSCNISFFVNKILENEEVIIIK